MTHPSLQKKTILVTGGAGFIGSHLCERLAKQGHRVISLDNYFAGSKENHVPGVEYREGHTKHIELLVPETPDIVYHLGEYARVEKSFEDVEKVWDLNKLGTFAVLEYVRKNGAKIVYAGSSTKFSDGGLGRDQSPYAWSKATNTELVKNYGTWYGVKFAVVYFYNVFGGRERGTGPYATLIGIYKEEYKKGNPLTVVAPGTQARNFTHVDDIVDGLVLVGENAEGDDYGIGNDDAHAILDVAHLFSNDIIMLPPRVGNRLQSTADNGKMKALGWSAKRSLKQDIADFLKQTTPLVQKKKHILVFTTTFAPVEGLTEAALRLLMETLPDVHFDVVTTRFTKDAPIEETFAPNVTVHRVGVGSVLDKFLLPFLGSRKARALMRQKEYLFLWALLASYASLAGLFVRRTMGAPLLITLGDQSFERLPWYMRFVLSRLLRGADQVHVSTSLQERAVRNIFTRMDGATSLGRGDAFANQIRFVYNTILGGL